MTTIDGIPLSAGTPSDANDCSSAVACALTIPLRANFVWRSNANVWTVEARANGRYIVARTRSRLNFSLTRQQGIHAIMQGLDIASVAENMTSTVASPGDNFIARFYEGERPLLRFSAVVSQALSMQVEVQHRDKHGNLISPPAAPPASWHKALRYYRLSQLSRDIYEAYRNLYLAYEALAESLYPRLPKTEREGEWVKRTLLEIDRKYGLAEFAPENHRNPSAYLYGTLYEHVRCNLFHARTADSILPFYEVESTKVQNAYQTLLGIWRRIVAAELSIGGGGAVITYAGYKQYMANVFGVRLNVEVADDSTPVSLSDTATSPANVGVVALSRSVYKGETVPGEVLVEAEEIDPAGLPCIRRMGLKIDDTLYSVSQIEGGLQVGAVDAFQVHLGFRLIQGSSPRTEF